MIGKNRAPIAGMGMVLATCLVPAPAQPPQSSVASEGPRWCEFAQEYLEMQGGKRFDCAAVSLRCIRMNNYSCTKNFSSHPYEGQMRTAQGSPIVDIAHHAVYEDPKWSVKASIDLLRRYYVQMHKRSAIEVAKTWAPWCDTDGSALIHKGWGRTCSDPPGPAPATFTGPRCVEPANGVPLRGQCGPCNCPNELAASYVRDLNSKVSDDLQLFTDDGQPTGALNKVLRQVVWNEVGFKPTDALINDAVAAYKHSPAH